MVQLRLNFYENFKRFKRFNLFYFIFFEKNFKSNNIRFFNKFYFNDEYVKKTNVIIHPHKKLILKKVFSKRKINNIIFF